MFTSFDQFKEEQSNFRYEETKRLILNQLIHTAEMQSIKGLTDFFLAFLGVKK